MDIQKDYGKQPFFMFINVIELHGPYWPPEPFRSKFLPSDVSDEEAKLIPPSQIGRRMHRHKSRQIKTHV